MSQPIRIRELSGWGFDNYPHRPAGSNLDDLAKAATIVAERAPFIQSNAVLQEQSECLREAFAHYATRSDLLTEMSGLSWSFGVVDLRQLLAFQRRLACSHDMSRTQVPSPTDWAALLKLSFGVSQVVEYEAFHDRLATSLVLRSSNPNLHIRFTKDPAHPLVVHCGGPFFEIARFCDRWFLRDGYHRAYALLNAGVYAVPSVIVEASTIEELGADQPWFFPKEVLFSENPPHVADFLNDDLVLQYDRRPFIKTIQIKLEETLEPETPTGEPL